MSQGVGPSEKSPVVGAVGEPLVHAAVQAAQATPPGAGGGPSQTQSQTQDGPSQTQSQDGPSQTQGQSQTQDGPSPTQSQDGPSPTQSQDGPSQTQSQDGASQTQRQSQAQDGPSQTQSQDGQSQDGQSQTQSQDGQSQTQSQDGQSQTQGGRPSLFHQYQSLASTFDELIDAQGRPRPEFRRVVDFLGQQTPEQVRRSQALADLALLAQGVTFSVYADNRGSEKIFPFDLVPRMVSARDWAHLERGLEQRVRALSAFLDDIYGEQKILSAAAGAARIPEALVRGSKGFVPSLIGVKPAGGVRIHISGIDLIRDSDGVFRVLEDNLRTPSGVSYVIENRLVMKRVLAAAFDQARVHRVDHYPTRLGDALRSVAPDSDPDPSVVLLTPGPFNSAFFEHSFLARMMGVELVQPADLFVADDRVFVKTTRGPRRVHVIYRRIDDAFLDPDVFRPESLLGVRGLMRAWAAGNVTLANAPGNGVADDKAIYPYVPDMVRFYLGEEPVLEQVRTFLCDRDDDRGYVLDHLRELVVKAVDEAGGYGMLMGPSATAAEIADFRTRVAAQPRRYIAQHRVELSSCPTWDNDAGRMVPRRVDLRPYIVTGRDGPWVLPGGLTRVALVAGSYVVNSSQGGGSKDTWVQK